MNTEAPASVLPNGIAEAEALPFERLVPPNEIKDPGASGVFWTKLAEFTAAASTGAGAKFPRPPVTVRVPVRLPLGLLAVTVTVTGPEVLPDTQVVLHAPPGPLDCMLSGGSPFEKDAVTVPLFRLLPQSSVTTVSSAMGQAAGTLKDWPSTVITGTSWEGVQPAAVCGAVSSEVEPVGVGAGVTMVRRPTRLTFPSENWNVSSALYTPGARLLVSG